MIEAQAVESAQLLSRPGPAGPAVIALRHDNAVPAVRGRDGRIDSEDAAVAGTDLAHHPQQEILVVTVDGSDQRAPSPRDQSASLRLVAIRHDGCGRTEDFH